MAGAAALRAGRPLTGFGRGPRPRSAGQRAQAAQYLGGAESLGDGVQVGTAALAALALACRCLECHGGAQPGRRS